MSALLTAPGRSNERIAISAIHVAFAVSILLHGLMLSGWLPKFPVRPSEKLGEGKPGGSLAVRLAPPPAPPPSPASPPLPTMRAPAVPSSPARSAPAPGSAQRPSPAEKMLALERPSAPRVAPPAESPPTPNNSDFAASIEARRRAREAASAPPPSRARASDPPNETAQERDNRIAAINLGLNRTPSFGDEKKHGGGIFQVERVGLDEAEFFFYGWNKAIKRNARQMIEVRRGNNASTELAVVRRMIAIIRDHESGDFIWESRRLGRDIWLSARSADTAGLEEFFMHEFFPGVRPRP